MTIHLYWHTEPPAELAALAERWSTVTGHQAIVWHPGILGDLHELISDSIGDVDERDHRRHGANVARWFLLSSLGGLWADTDVTPLRALPADWADAPWSAGLARTPTPFICGGPPGAPWDRALAESLGRPQGTSPHASGGAALARACRRGDLLLRPAGLFAATDAAGRPLPEPPGGRYCSHEWATSRQRAHEAGSRPT